MGAGLLAVLGWVVIGSFTPSMVKFAVNQVPPITLTFFRFLFASLILLPFYLRAHNKISRKQLLQLASAGVLGTAVNAALYAFGLSFTGTIISQIWYATTPILVAIIGFIFIREKINKYQIVGAVIGFLGVVFLVSESFGIEHVTFGTPLGNGIVLVAVLVWACYTVLSRKLSKDHSALTISFVGFVAGSITLGVLMPLELFLRHFSLQNISLEAWGEIFYLSVIASVAGFLLYQFALKRTSAFITSLALYLSPLFVTLPGVVLLHEQITPSLLVGAILVLIGVFFATTFSQIRQRGKSVLQ